MESEEKAPEPVAAQADPRYVDTPDWLRYMALAEEAMNSARSTHHRETSTTYVREAEGWTALANAVTGRDGLTIAREMAERQAQAWEG